jgi:hypothetical protein
MFWVALEDNDLELIPKKVLNLDNLLQQDTGGKDNQCCAVLPALLDIKLAIRLS